MAATKKQLPPPPPVPTQGLGRPPLHWQGKEIVHSSLPQEAQTTPVMAPDSNLMGRTPRSPAAEGSVLIGSQILSSSEVSFPLSSLLVLTNHLQFNTNMEPSISLVAKTQVSPNTQHHAQVVSTGSPDGTNQAASLNQAASTNTNPSAGTTLINDSLGQPTPIGSSQSMNNVTPDLELLPDTNCFVGTGDPQGAKSPRAGDLPHPPALRVGLTCSCKLPATGRTASNGIGSGTARSRCCGKPTTSQNRSAGPKRGPTTDTLSVSTSNLGL
jgi:hypothetical protein